MFLQVRDIARQKIAEVVETLLPGLGADAVQALTTYAVAGADGLFIHHEIAGDGVDLVAMFELHADLVFAAATRMAARD